MVYKRINAKNKTEFDKKIKKALKDGWKESKYSYCFCGSTQACLFKDK